jgi:hypothetical protein
MLEKFNIYKSVNVICHINRMKRKNHMIISINAERAFDKVKHCFMISTLNKLGKERNYLNTTKEIDEKPKSCSIINVEKLKSFSLKHRSKKGCLFTSSIKHGSGSPSQNNWPREMSKMHLNKKERRKITSVFR